METRPNIPEFTIGDYTDLEKHNKVRYFGFFSKDEITREAGRLTMLDIDFGRECSLKCPSCFRRNNIVDDSQNTDLTYDELLSVISDARELGLREIKICGAGEPFENPDLIRFARQLTEWDIGLSIFTKGHILGNDEYAKKIFHHEGIVDSQSLATALFNLKTSVLLSFQSFKLEIQDRVVGNIWGHSERRNRAAEILINTGFNKCLPTRIAFCSNPITQDNYEEIFDIYTYCRERNILPIVAALMVSGKQFNHRFLSHIDVSDEEKIQIYIKIYEYNMEHGIQPLDIIMEEGISSMPGIHPCNQIASGLYITCNGNVLICPGDSLNILGNVKQKNISKIWFESPNYTRRGTFNCKCPPKAGRTLPRDLYSKVLSKIHCQSFAHDNLHDL